LSNTFTHNLIPLAGNLKKKEKRKKHGLIMQMRSLDKPGWTHQQLIIVLITIIGTGATTCNID